ncbi:MAG: alpha/beta fold hydrolase [Bacillota bacterium]
MQQPITAHGPAPLFHRRAGAIGTPVVLIHGIPTHSFLWHGVIPLLAEQHQVIAPDLRGYGASPGGPVEELTLPRQAEQILALLDSLGIAQAHFVGHDLGGGIAQILAVDHPERVLSVAITDGVCFSNWPLPVVVAMRYPSAPEFEPGPAVVQEMLRRGVHNQDLLTPEIMQAFLQPVLSPEGPSRLQLAAMALEHHQTERLADRLGEIQAPMTVLWGQFDRFLPAYWGWRLHQAVGHSAFHLLPACGHFTMLDNPVLLARHLLDHLVRAEQALPPPARLAQQPQAAPPPLI